ncbi:hypothetical protein QE152_g38397 [Popillia japonica]|uniref:Leucine-rich repeat-containing protein 23 n=1 Tax=Popillia japonica TaxID=7064 RepID=A0AAW1HYG8_POPJA
MDEEEIPGEDHDLRKLIGEDLYGAINVPQVVTEKVLTFEEASKCLNTLGKDESAVRYAYLMISPLDRKLTNIAMILNFKHLLFIDVSGNFLTLDGLQVLSEMPYVLYIKAQRNMIESAALNPMPYLQVLSLSRNCITETCDINQPMMQCLDLNYNQIYTAQFDVARTEALKQLEMRGNQLFDISGSFPLGLENLYLAENKIARFCENDLGRLVNLKILHLRDNQIRKLNGFSENLVNLKYINLRQNKITQIRKLNGFSENLVNLKYINLRQNKITKVRQFRKLDKLPSLETLVVLQNPVSGGDTRDAEIEEDEDAEIDEEERLEDMIRVPILILLPNLKRINKVAVTHEEREEAYETKEERTATEILEPDWIQDIGVDGLRIDPNFYIL